MTILAGFLWGTSFPAIKIGLQFMDAYTFVFLRFLVASIALLVVSLRALPLMPMGPFSAEVFILLPWNAWLAILYTALFCWVIPYYLWLRGLKHISPVTSSVVLLTEIVVAMSISTIFLGEALTVASGFGAIFIIVAMLLVSQADHSENKASTTV